MPELIHRIFSTFFLLCPLAVGCVSTIRGWLIAVQLLGRIV